MNVSQIPCGRILSDTAACCPDGLCPQCDALTTYRGAGNTIEPADDQDYRFLSMATDKGNKLALPIGHLSVPWVQIALERAIEQNWIRLVDVTPLAAMDGIFRVFVVQDTGIFRLSTLQKRFARASVN